MGNSASSGVHNHDHGPRTTTVATAASTPHAVHRSLRTKKKSLELPDLASLSLTPTLISPTASPHPHYHHPKASSPIPIPAQSAAANTNAQHPYQSYPRPSQLPSTTDVLGTQSPPQRYRPASVPSFAPGQLPPIDDHDHEPARPAFVAETVTSTIPLGLRQAQRPAPDAPHDLVLTSTNSPPPGVDGAWTAAIPPALLTVAQEEEAYLADGAQGPAPNIPPVPVLPRHLDKHMLNARRRESDSGRVRSRTRLAMTGAGAGSEAGAVTPASGTDLSVPAAEALALADDASVLPVPSHVVVHHLSTSAIRNGVLAVGNATRYKTKFITTIYYKPT